MNVEQFAQFLHVMQVFGGAAKSGQQGDAASHRTQNGIKPIVARLLRVDTFKGNLQEWDDWSFAFKH